MIAQWCFYSPWSTISFPKIRCKKNIHWNWDWEASNGHTKDTRGLFHGPWHDPVGEHISAQPFRMWNTLHFHPFLQISKIFQRCKSDANKQDFENKLNLTCQAQSIPNGDLNQGILQLWSNFGGCSLNGWWVIARTSSKFGKFWFWSLIWPWRSKSSNPQNNRDINQGLLHLWSKFGGSSLNWCWVITWTNLVTDGRTDWLTDAGNVYTRRPILASGKIITKIK